MVGGWLVSIGMAMTVGDGPIRLICVGVALLIFAAGMIISYRHSQPWHKRKD
jgi:predicted Kef-type K+ transport protein